MTSAVAIQATFSDVKNIRGRKVVQLVFEIPIEQADHALSVLGGLPRSDSERWFGIVALAGKQKEPIVPEKKRTPFNEMPLPQQVAMRCTDPNFQRFLNETGGTIIEIGSESATEAAAQYVRAHCKVSSRREIKPQTEAARLYKQLDDDYFGWQRGLR